MGQRLRLIDTLESKTLDEILQVIWNNLPHFKSVIKMCKGQARYLLQIVFCGQVCGRGLIHRSEILSTDDLSIFDRRHGRRS